MPGKRSSKKYKEEEEEVSNGSGEEYSSGSDDDESEFESDLESDEQSGGVITEDDATELGEDNYSFEIDPDHEQEYDENRDETYDPVTEMEEVPDPDIETEVEEEKIVDEEIEEEIEEELEELEEEITGEERAGVARVCHMKNLDKDFIVLDEDDSSMYGTMEYKRVPDEERQTVPIMTYYEMVRIIGTRGQQFNFGAKPLVDGVEQLHPAKMAYVELMAKMTPFIIRRHLPGKKYEEWWIEELEIIHEITDDFFVPENFDKDLLTRPKK